MSVADALTAYFDSAREVNNLILRVGRSQDGHEGDLRHQLDAARERRADALSLLEQSAPDLVRG